jgi:hypothetical protein
MAAKHKNHPTPGQKNQGTGPAVPQAINDLFLPESRPERQEAVAPPIGDANG